MRWGKTPREGAHRSRTTIYKKRITLFGEATREGADRSRTMSQTNNNAIFLVEKEKARP